MRRNLEIYYEAAEKAGFPDMRNRGLFKFGWAAERRRGIMTSRYLHITRLAGKGDARTGGAGARAAVRLLRTIRLRRRDETRAAKRGA